MSKTYPVGIVGEASYQATIRRCSTGQRVYIFHEPDNPYDELALAVAAGDGRTLGYIARDCWLRDAVHEEHRGCEATIKEISAAGGGQFGVVIDVALCGGGIETRPFDRMSGERANDAKGLLARLFGF